MARKKQMTLVAARKPQLRKWAKREQVVGPRLPAIAPPTGGTSPDSEARATLAEILAALAQHGLIET